MSNQLTDKDLTEFLVRARDNLKPGGIIFIKENVADKIREVDLEDFSSTRNLAIYL